MAPAFPMIKILWQRAEVTGIREDGGVESKSNRHLFSSRVDVVAWLEDQDG